MRRWKRLLVPTLAAVATLASSAIPGMVSASYPDIMGCYESCQVVAGGWPFPYVVDYPGLSPVHSASLFGVVLGVDRLWAGSLAATLLFWFALFVTVAWTVSRRRAIKRV
jgi:hypothetical protein